jgi:hypothetical protein
MAASNIDNLQRRMADDDRPGGIPRPGHLGAATTEFVLVLFAALALACIALAFYYGSR